MKSKIIYALALITSIHLLLSSTLLGQEVLPNGSFSYDIPIDSPPGTGGMKPALALKYNSNGGNGWVGTGWSLGGFPVITRDVTYDINFDSDDHYIYSGQQLIFDGSYYHTERENYERIQAFNLNSPTSYWKVTAQNGTKMYFGYNSSEHSTTNDGHIDAVGKGGKALVWALSRVEDVHGNYLTIEYDEDTSNGTYYPELVTYTQGNGVTAGYKTIEFAYESRTDHFKTYVPTLVDMNKRLTTITIKFDGNLLRKYELDYEYGTTSGLSRLIRVTQYGSDGTTSLPPQEFTWDEGKSGYDQANVWTPTGTFYDAHDPYSNVAEGAVTYADLIDMNADGRPDRVFHYNQQTNTYGLWVALNNGAGFDSAALWLTSGTYYAPHDPYVRVAEGAVTYADLIDMNADGRPDRVFHYNQQTNTYGLWVALNNGAGFDSAALWLTSGTYYAPHDPYVRVAEGAVTYADLIDMNADGRPDRVFHYNQQTNTYGLWVALNNGAGFDSAALWLTSGTYYAPHDPYVRVAEGAVTYADLIDMNADGRPDRVFHYNQQTNTYGLWVALNNGAGFDSAALWLTSGTYYAPHDPYVRVAEGAVTYADLIDMNADGRPDRVFHYNQQTNTYGLWVALNNGAGFDPPLNNEPWLDSGTYYPPHDPYSRVAEGAVTYASLIDMNADGRPDRVFHYNQQANTYGLWVALNNGAGFDPPLNNEPWLDSGTYYPPHDPYSRVTEGAVTYADLIDMNGDGRPDRVFHYNQQTNTYGLWVALNKQDTPDVIFSINNGKGATVAVSYSPATLVTGAVAPENTNYPEVANRSPRLLVTNLVVDSGMDAPASTSYEYSNGQMQMGFWWEIENLGFETIKKIDDVTGNYVINTYYQDPPFHGMVQSVASYDADDNPYVIVQNTFDQRIDNAAFPDIKFLYKTELTTTDYNGDATATPRVNKITYSAYGPYGNVTAKTDYGDLSVTSDDTTTSTEFAVNTSNYVVVPSRTYSYGYKLDGTWALSTETRLYYDGNATLGNVDVGLVTRQEQENGSEDVVETYGYDVHGNQTWMKDGRANAGEYSGNTLETTYDSYCHVYITSETNALGHSTTTDYSPLIFRPTSITDVNGVATNFEHDPFGNVIKTIRPEDSASQPTEETVYNYTDTIAPTCVVTKRRDGASTIDTYTYYDGLGRVIQVKTKGQEANEWITTDTWYNHIGKVIKTSVPYITVGTPNANIDVDPRDTSQNSTVTEYDDADRPTRITKPDGTYAEFEYDLYATTTIDGNRHVTQTEIIGATKTIKEYTGTYPSHTLYATTTTLSGIDGVQVTDNAGNVTTTTLDLLKRKMSTSDPDMGTWTYAYDANGNVVSQTDAKNQTISFLYDPLDRVLQKDHPDNSDSFYYYDQPGHGYSVGQLTGVVYGASYRGIVASYPFNIDANDTSGNGNHGTNNGATLTPGLSHNGMLFDGVDDVIEVDDNASLNFGADDSFTITVWARDDGVTSAQTWSAIVQKSDPRLLWTSTHPGYGIGRHGSSKNRFRFGISDGTTVRHVSSNSLSDGFHFLTLVVDRTNDAMKAYVDGQQIGITQNIAAIGSIDVPRPLKIGYNNYKYFKGVIDEVKIYDHVLSDTEILDAYNDIALDLITHLPFEGNANDIVGDNDGAVMGATPAPGVAGQAYNFDGEDNKIELGLIDTSNPLQLNSGGTIMAWCKQQSGGDSWQRVIDKSTGGSGANGYYLALHPSSRSVWLGVDGTNFTSSSSAYNFDEWTHVTAVISATGHEIHVNGQLISSFSSTVLPPSYATNMRVGTWNHAAGREFKGDIDEVKIYDRALTASEIQNAYDDYSGYTGGALQNYDSFTYDSRGRVIAKSRAIDGEVRTMYSTYDSLDRLTSLIYPDNEVVTISNTSQGTTSVIGDNDYLRTASFNAFNQITQFEYGNSVTTTYDYYDTATEYDSSAGTYYSHRLRQITTSPSSILRLQYGYDPVGNVKTKTDLNTSSYSETYAYDHLARLTTASATVYGAKSYTYDPIGNMLTKDGRTYTYGFGNHQVTADGVYTYEYDANGNMIYKKQSGTVVQAYSYNYDNMIESVDDDGDVSFYSYFDINRVRKDENGTITRYFFAEYEEEEDVSTGQITELKYYFANNQRLARDSSVDGLAYYHQDHLGSSTRMTDAAGTVIRTMGYQPYGTDSYSTGSASVKYKYTGQEKDNTGLYYYGARFYDPDLGRFLQADTIIPYPDDPQSFNRYSYVRNNPIKYIDPSGNIFGLALNSLFINQAAVGAAFGAAFSAVTGGDVLEGALNGAIDGYFKSLFGPAFGGGIAGFVDAQLNGGNAGQAALSGYISGAIEGLAAAVGFGVGSLSLEPWIGDLVGLGISGFSGSLSGGISAEISGGDFSDGAANGAIGGVISYGIAIDLPDAVQNAFTENPRFHLFLNFALKVFDVAYAGYKVGNAIVGADEWDVALGAVGDLVDPTPRVFKGIVKGGGKLLGVAGKASKSKIQRHHSDPKFLGGNKNQPLTNLPTNSHQQLHKDLNAHLRNVSDKFGNHMRPQRGNSGAKIRANFSRQERLKATADFYRQNQNKYPEAATDFFKQHPGL